MTHKAKQRQIFALLDEQLSARKKRRLLHHLEGCKECSAFFEQVNRLRKLSKEALETEDPDWTAIDRSVERAIAESISARDTERSLVPVTLAIASAAAIALAIAMPMGDRLLPRDRSPTLGQDQARVAPTSFKPRLLKVQVLDTLEQKQPPFEGHVLTPDYMVETSWQGGLRLALGPEAGMESGPASRWHFPVLDADSPAVRLERGRIQVTLPPDSLTIGRGLEILAGGASLHVLWGMIEVLLSEDSLVVSVIEGDVFAVSGQDLNQLDKGVWKAALNKPLQKSDDWDADLRLASPFNDPIVDSDAAIEEKAPSRYRGTLPRRVIRETLDRSTPGIRDCYEGALKRDPSLALLVKIRVRVGRSGAVTSTNISGLDDSSRNMKQCLIRVFEELRFPRPRGGPLELVLPLRLYPKQ